MNNNERQYLINLFRVIKQVRERVDSSIVPLVKQYADPGVIAQAMQRAIDDWTNPLQRAQAERIASSFVTTSLGSITRQAERREQSVGINIYQGSTELQEYLRAATFQNTQLIKSIPAQYLDQVSNIVMGNIRQGMRPSYIEAELVKQFGVTQRRAKLIARDQHSKITGEINRLRQTGAGIEYFRWVTSQDERVRHSHVAVAKRDVGYGAGIFRWDDLPVVDGVPTFPGQPVNCRCVSVAVTNAAVGRNKKTKEV